MDISKTRLCFTPVASGCQETHVFLYGRSLVLSCQCSWSSFLLLGACPLVHCRLHHKKLLLPKGFLEQDLEVSSGSLDPSLVDTAEALFVVSLSLWQIQNGGLCRLCWVVCSHFFSWPLLGRDWSSPLLALALQLEAAPGLSAPSSRLPVPCVYGFGVGMHYLSYKKPQLIGKIRIFNHNKIQYGDKGMS